jgi:prepilin-type N-terminal cleavage/methylation domain-containing protein
MRRKSPGFTLIELSIVLLISGLLLGAAIQLYDIYQQQKKMSDTVNAIGIVQAALGEFRGNNGRYPCPARFDAPVGSEDAGREDCVHAKHVLGADADGDGNPDVVLIGAVPYATMIDPDKDPATNYYSDPSDGGLSGDVKGFTPAITADAWGGRLTYAVTEKLTDKGTFDENLGAIDVQDEHSQSVLEKPGSAHLVVFSHGPNSRGAYSANGSQISSCALSGIPGPPGPGIPSLDETTNCLFDDGLFLAGLRNENDSHYNDDILSFKITKSSQLWSMVSGEQAHNTNSGSVGIGTDAPTERLEIDGNLRAITVRADQFCDQGGGTCMPPSVLGGDDPDMVCPPGKVMRAIANNKVNDEDDTEREAQNYNCVDPFKDSIKGLKCPAGEYMIGISNIGGVVCAPKS